MVVWAVIESVQWEGAFPVSIWTDKLAAEKELLKLNALRDSRYYIRQWTLDSRDLEYAETQ